jgi:hypothetical protein
MRRASVYPSRYARFGVSPVEAMRMGCTLVCTQRRYSRKSWARRRN